MAKEARSKGACWTCRLRRKKCDELSPICVACSSHSLPCYGYEKPDWADGGKMQKAKNEELRVIIRDAASSKRLLLKQRASKPFIGSKDISQKVAFVDVDNIVPVTSQLAIDAEPATGQPPHHYVEIREMFTGHLTDQIRDQQVLCNDPGEELLAHYIDFVFPSQFPISPDSRNAREWFLPIVLQVKPLYHAAVSIAVYHKELSGEVVGDKNYGSIHHGLALKELRQYLAECHGYNLLVSLESNIEVLASIVLLVSLEVLTGDTDSWFIHLKGPLLLLPSLQTACEKRSSLSPEHRKALQFFAGVIVWYNALSCVSTGLKPWAPISCLRTAINGWVNVHMITGCQNAVAISIIETAALSEQITRRGFEEPGMVETARQIDTDLREWIQPLGTIIEQSCPTDELVTRVFASAAQIYLNVVVAGSGFDSDLPKICISVCQSLVALEAIADLQVLGTLAWPLCITGSVATGWQRDVMRKIFISMGNVPSLQRGGMDRCRKLIEECWRLRQEECHTNADLRTTWTEAMNNLELTVLLV